MLGAMDTRLNLSTKYYIISSCLPPPPSLVPKLEIAPKPRLYQGFLALYRSKRLSDSHPKLLYLRTMCSGICHPQHSGDPTCACFIRLSREYNGLSNFPWDTLPEIDGFSETVALIWEWSVPRRSKESHTFW
jgi:hypothetical protein